MIDADLIIGHATGETSPAERQAMNVSKSPSAFMILSLWTLLKMHAAELGSTTIIFGRFSPKLS